MRAHLSTFICISLILVVLKVVKLPTKRVVGSLYGSVWVAVMAGRVGRRTQPRDSKYIALPGAVPHNEELSNLKSTARPSSKKHLLEPLPSHIPYPQGSIGSPRDVHFCGAPGLVPSVGSDRCNVRSFILTQGRCGRWVTCK